MALPLWMRHRWWPWIPGGQMPPPGGLLFALLLMAVLTSTGWHLAARRAWTRFEPTPCAPPQAS
ncbi:MAG: hypothetical protein HOQ21_02665 [Dermatophilaceae bacterium]|nr:hypothetical protein [Dermatophilaceae bacterium]